MATRPLEVISPALTFPAPGVAASIQRAIAAAGRTRDRQAQTAWIEAARSLGDAGRTCAAMRLHASRPDTPGSPARLSARSEPA
jgi:hypothetical protein